MKKFTYNLRASVVSELTCDIEKIANRLGSPLIVSDWKLDRPNLRAFLAHKLGATTMYVAVRAQGVEFGTLQYIEERCTVLGSAVVLFAIRWNALAGVYEVERTEVAQELKTRPEPCTHIFTIGTQFDEFGEPLNLTAEKVRTEVAQILSDGGAQGWSIFEGFGGWYDDRQSVSECVEERCHRVEVFGTHSEKWGEAIAEAFARHFRQCSVMYERRASVVRFVSA